MTTHQTAASARPTRSAAIVATATAVLLFAAACGGGPLGTPGPSGPPGPSPSGGPSPTTGEIDHPTGSIDVVLRFEEGGGFVPMGFLAGQAPIFSLYGDGTVIFRDTTQPQPQPIGDAQPQLPYQAVRLTEDQVQELLGFVIGPGGLGIARASYVQGGIADAPTSIFTLNAGGQTKTVSVYALGFDNPQSPDVIILRALATAGDRLRAFSAPGAVPWMSDRFRGVLTEDAFGQGRDWPWSDIAPADFKPLQLPTGTTWTARTMTRAEIDVLGFEHVEGGILNVVLNGPGDGKVYALTLRPLLPDEAA